MSTHAHARLPRIHNGHCTRYVHPTPACSGPSSDASRITEKGKRWKAKETEERERERKENKRREKAKDRARAKEKEREKRKRKKERKPEREKERKRERERDGQKISKTRKNRKEIKRDRTI